MFKKQLKVNIKELDLKIGKLTEEISLLDDTETDKIDAKVKRLETLTDLRCKLAESKVNGSITPVVVSGLLGMASLILVLQFEEENVITSKAINMLPNMFRGGK